MDRLENNFCLQNMKKVKENDNMIFAASFRDERLVNIICGLIYHQCEHLFSNVRIGMHDSLSGLFKLLLINE